MKETIKIGPIVYSVVYKNLDPYLGLIDFKRRTIFIEKKGSRFDKMTAKFHEALHGVVANCGLRAVTDCEWALDELMVRSIEIGILNLMADNVKLFQTILEELDARRLH